MQIDVRNVFWSIGLLALISLPAHGANPILDGLVDSVLRHGRDGQLPPHLSRVLGIGGDTAVDVKQAVLRDGPEVRVFNVCVANHKNVVILRTNEQERITKAYLVSAAGRLRLAVSFHAGGQTRQTPTAEASAALADEIKFWTEFRQRRTPERGAPVQ